MANARKARPAGAAAAMTVVFYQCPRELADELLDVAERRGVTRAELLRVMTRRIVAEGSNGKPPAGI